MGWRWLSCVVIVVPIAWAQPALTLRGLFLRNWHVAQLRDAGGIINCGTLRSGTGNGWGAAVGIEFPFSNMCLELGLILGRRDGILTTQNAFPFRDTITGAVVDVNTEVQLQNSWLIAQFQPMLHVLFGDRLRAMGGFWLGTSLAARFRQEEQILSPDTVFFLLPDGRRVQSRLLYEGNFRNRTRFQLGATVGLEHTVRLGGRWQWLQRFGVEYTLSSLLKEAPWRLWTLQAEMGLRWEITPPRSERPLPPPPLSPPPVAEHPPAEPSPSVFVQPLEIQARIRTGYELLATPPVVPAVFFAQNSADIPERYKRTMVEKELTELDALTVHQFVLPYIAQILKRYAQAHVVLGGATSGEDEPGGIELARRRAEAVRRALIELGVPAERITLRWSLLPPTPSNPAYAEGREENRRVDIVVLKAPTIEYVRHQRFRELVGNLTLRIQCRNTDPQEQLELSISCNDTPVHLPCSVESIHSLPLQCRLPQSEGSFPLFLRAVAPKSGVASDAYMEVHPLAYPHDTVLLDLRRFRAVLRFDYNSSQLLPEVEERLRQLVSFLPPSASVTIYGSTDALGTEQRNIELTAERARRTAEFLKALSPTIRIRTAALPPERKFPETLPEGRFLNRSIWIEAEL